MAKIPTDLKEQVQWLVDREAIRELLCSYTKHADANDFENLRDLYTEDGYYTAPTGRIYKKDIVAFSHDAHAGTHNSQHMLGQHSIEIDGDTAKSRAYFAAYFGKDKDDLMQHADIGGWYYFSFRRTDEGWKIAKVGGQIIWASGDKFKYIEQKEEIEKNSA